MPAWRAGPHAAPLRLEQAQPLPEPITGRVAFRWSMPTGRWSRVASRRRGQRFAAVSLRAESCCYGLVPCRVPRAVIGCKLIAGREGRLAKLAWRLLLLLALINVLPAPLCAAEPGHKQ